MGAIEAVYAAAMMTDGQESPGTAISEADLSDLTPEQRRTLGNVPESLKPTFLRAYRGSKAAGIKSFCLACVGFVKKDITGCTAFGCPLYPHRPYRD